MATKTQDKTAERVSQDSTLGSTPNQAQALTTTDYDVDDLGAGFEDTDAADFKLPWLRPLQKGSPEVDEDSKSRMEGAKAGMFLNTATGELVDGKAGFRFIAVHRTHQFVEFVPRAQGGGFVAVYQPNDPLVVAALKKSGKAFGKHPFGDGNELVETFTMFGLYEPRPNEDWRPVVLPFASSAIDAYKTIMTKLDMLRVNVPGRGKVPLPMFASQLLISTEFAENKKGAWHRMKADFAAPDAEKARIPKDHPLYIQAKMFRNLVTSNKAVVDHDTSGVAEETVQGETAVGPENKAAF
jgi:hypothetical protein